MKMKHVISRWKNDFKYLPLPRQGFHRRAFKRKIDVSPQFQP